jgi:ABC-type glycerol-3-phosphate transport system substrate-binding protein
MTHPALRFVVAMLLLAPALAGATEQLVVWGLSSQSEWDRGTQVLTEAFEQRYGVEVQTFSPGSFDEQKVLSAIAGGVAPDLLPLGAYARDWVARWTNSSPTTRPALTASASPTSTPPPWT